MRAGGYGFRRFWTESWSEFRDLEVSGAKLDLDPRAVRAAYLDEMRGFLAAIEKGCGQMDVDYAPLSTKRPFDEALTGYLAHRQGLAR